MRLLVFDTETTGLLDEEDSSVVEIGAVVWDTELDRMASAMSLIVDDGTREVRDEITRINGITGPLIERDGISPKLALQMFNSMSESCDGHAARNGLKFDWPFLRKMADSCEGMELRDKPLIDDCVDIEYPPDHRGRTLSHVAADHGFLNPFPHTALGDAMTLMRVLQLGGYDMEEAFRSASHPLVEVRAAVSYDDRHLAKDRGFRWDPERRIWAKVMREHRYDVTAYPFKTEFRRTR